jgi:hypothetical protein
MSTSSAHRIDRIAGGLAQAAGSRNTSAASSSPSARAFRFWAATGRLLHGRHVLLRVALERGNDRVHFADLSGLGAARLVNRLHDVGDAARGSTTFEIVVPAASTWFPPSLIRPLLAAMSSGISFASVALRCASTRTSPATTAFNDRRLVWNAIESITATRSVQGRLLPDADRSTSDHAACSLLDRVRPVSEFGWRPDSAIRTSQASRYQTASPAALAAEKKPSHPRILA